MKTNVFRLFERDAFLNVSEPLKKLLVKLSLVNFSSADLVENLAKDPSLEIGLSQLSGFIRYDAYLNAYEAHPIFWEYLNQKQNILTEEEKREVFLTAADWCVRNNYKKDALEYYEKAGDYLAAASVICDYGSSLSRDAEEFGLEVLERAPRDIVKNNPLALIARLNLMLTLGRFDGVLREALSFEKEVLSSPDPDYFQLSEAMRRAAIARYFLCAFDGRYDFEEYFIRQNEYFSKRPGKLKAFQCSGPRILTLGASRPEDVEIYVKAIERCETAVTHPSNAAVAGFADLAKGELAFYQNDIKSAEKFFALGLEKSEERRDIQNRVLFYQIRLAFFKGEDAASIERRIVELSSRLLEKIGGNKYITCEIVKAWYYTASRRPKLAAEIFQNGFSYGKGDFFSESMENWVKARYYYAIGKYDELLSYISARGQKEIFLLGKLEIKALEAVCRNQLKDKEGALKTLEEAYALAAPAGLIAPFIELGKDMRTLSALAIKSESVNIPKERLELINRKASAYAKRQSHIASGYKDADRGASLSRREREILEDISRGLSRSEIAASRGLSINTIKATVSMVYSKLGACNMAEVIRIAAENELLKN
jgi:LuxR family maltose regulon positive regulatory protein